MERDSAVAWKSALWYWNTQTGPGTMTPHNAMVNGAGFGQTIRSVNGSLECDGRNPVQVQSRVKNYQRFTQILGVSPAATCTADRRTAKAASPRAAGGAAFRRHRRPREACGHR